MLCIGALPFLFSARTYASEESKVEGGETSTESKWLDDYHQHVGLTYSAQAVLQTTYLWRGLYVGAMNMQLDASVGYGGLYFDTWWNIGTADWSFKTFQPEVDLTLGFSRWGLTLSATYIYSFNRPFFDFTNHPDGGNVLELWMRYTVSSKLPLSIYWGTRLAGSDGYLNAVGDTIRAYSTYVELSYTHHFPYDISLYGAVGFTPWKSLYTGYQRGFAVNNVEIRLRKDWSLHERCGLFLQGVFAINPSALAADHSTAEWHPVSPGRQSINANVALGVYLK